MNTYHDYESWGMQSLRRPGPEPLPESRLSRSRVNLLEQFSGTDIVEWWHKIYDQLIKQEQEADKARNFTYVDKLRSFRKVWQDNKIDGSINVDPLNALYSAASVLGADTWNLASYFRTLATSLDVVIQSEQQLPRGVDMSQNEPMLNPGGGGGGAPPMSPAFGPDEEPPPGAEGGEGGLGGAGGGGGGAPMTGAENGAPGEEQQPGGPPPDETMPPPAQAGQPTQTGAMGGEAGEIEPEEAERAPERI